MMPQIFGGYSGEKFEKPEFSMKAAEHPPHGLSERNMRTIEGILRKYPDLRQVCAANVGLHDGRSV